MEKTIYGGKPKNPVAYCALHNGSLTVKEMKKKGCLGKQCHHLQILAVMLYRSRYNCSLVEARDYVNSHVEKTV